MLRELVLGSVGTTFCGEVPELDVFKVFDATKGVLSRSWGDVITYTHRWWHHLKPSFWLSTSQRRLCLPLASVGPGAQGLLVLVVEEPVAEPPRRHLLPV